MSRPRPRAGRGRLRRPRAAPPRRRAAALLGAVVAALVLPLLAVPHAPASALPGDADEPTLVVTLDALSPSVLTGAGDRLRLTGRVTNPGGSAWTSAVVSMVTRTSPAFTSEALDEAVRDPGRSTVGSPLTGSGATASLGTVGAGQSRPFVLDVPFEQLGLDGQAGVYPVGAEVVATEPGGERSERPVDGSFTFVPLVARTDAATAVSLVLPFTAPVERTSAGRYTDQAALLASVSDGGRLRRLLDLGRATVAAGPEAAQGTTVLLDPALLDAVADLAGGGPAPGTPGTEPTDDGTPDASPSEPARTEETDADAVAADAFLDDLLALARTTRLWALPYGEPDVQGLLDAGDGGADGPALARLARSGSEEVLARYDLTARPVSWPANGIASAEAVAAGRAAGDRSTVLSPRVLPGWEPADGSVLRAGGGADDRVVVRDPRLLRGGSDRASALGVRQRILAEAALASLGDDPVRQLVAVLGPDLDPGPGASSSALEQVFAPTWTTPADPDGRPQAWGDGVRVPQRLRPTPIRPAQVTAARSAVAAARHLGAVTGDAAQARAFRESAALAVSQSWRQDPSQGVRRAAALDRAVSGRLGQVSVETTPVITLPGSSGQVPLSVTNDLDVPVTVGVRLEATGPTVDAPDVQPFELQPGQRQTVRVEVDVGETTSSVMTARLTSPDGETFGDASRFTVRSSLVGRTVWVVMGGAGALLLVALARRFVARRRPGAPGEDGDAA